MAERECEICAGPHDATIHEATLRIHEWLREDIALKLKPVVAPVAEPKETSQEEKPKRLPRKRAA
jgi:hypothetical protein